MDVPSLEGFCCNVCFVGTNSMHVTAAVLPAWSTNCIKSSQGWQTSDPWALFQISAPKCLWEVRIFWHNFFWGLEFRHIFLGGLEVSWLSRGALCESAEVLILSNIALPSLELTACCSLNTNSESSRPRTVSFRVTLCLRLLTSLGTPGKDDPFYKLILTGKNL